MDTYRKRPIIVVSGLPRSGTSLMMQILDKAGLPPLTDQLRTADIDNQQGYYEYEPVKFMKNGNLDWMTLAQGKAVKIISHLLLDLPADYQYKVIFMLRNLAEVVASQNRMLENKGELENKSANEELAKYFTGHIQQTKDWIAAQPNIDTVYVDYNNLILDPAAELRPIEAFLGLQLTKPEIISIVDTKYYRQRSAS